MYNKIHGGPVPTEMSHLPKHMSNGANADDNIKCLPEGDSHSVKTIKLDERLQPGNNELIWFPNAPFHPLGGEPDDLCVSVNIAAF